MKEREVEAANVVAMGYELRVARAASDMLRKAVNRARKEGRSLVGVT